MGFSNSEICTGPDPLGGNLATGSGISTLFFLCTGLGVHIGATGAIGALAMIAWFMTLFFICEYLGFGSPLNYEGFTADASGKARFSGKIPERSEDDFSRNRKA